MSPSPVSSPSSDAARIRKTTLFCQDCGHASPVDGDWRVRTVGGRQRVRCPECRSVVDERQLPEQEHPDVDGPAPVQRYVGALSRYWSAWTTLFDDPRADC